MPIYVYKCNQCNNEIEVYEKNPTIKNHIYCEVCQSNQEHRLLIKGVALKFKGTGFYTTDHRDYKKYNKR